MAERRPKLVITCEHARHRVPRELHPLFRGAWAELRSHRGWDAGAEALARHLAQVLRAPLTSASFTRLVADLNRSPDHPEVWSARTRALPAAQRAQLLARYHTPYREAVSALVMRQARSSAVGHLAVHSFTPVLDGQVRKVDVGVLFDPQRGYERRTAEALVRALRQANPCWRVRRNAPYEGRSDGLTRWLRTLVPDARYAGIELEVNQRWLRSPWAPSTHALVARACLVALAHARAKP